jgi:uncharacterized membrane protein
MLHARDFRHIAWNKLNGKWGTMVVITLIAIVILSACGSLFLWGVGEIALLLLTGPLTLGLIYCALCVVRQGNLDIKMMFDGFNNFVNALILYIINNVFIALWSLLLVIPGIVKAYSYSMSFYILADNLGLAANDARKQSMVLMHGNKWRLFCLHLSFIGWLLLSGITFGILLLWVIPYMQTATAEFYQDLISRQAPQVDEFTQHKNQEEQNV